MFVFDRKQKSTRKRQSNKQTAVEMYNNGGEETVFCCIQVPLTSFSSSRATKCQPQTDYRKKWNIISELLLFAYQHGINKARRRRRRRDVHYNDDVLHSVSIYIRRIGSKHLHKNVRAVSLSTVAPPYSHSLHFVRCNLFN